MSRNRLVLMGLEARISKYTRIVGKEKGKKLATAEMDIIKFILACKQLKNFTNVQINK